MLEKRLESVLSRKVNLDRIRVDKIAESNRYIVTPVDREAFQIYNYTLKHLNYVEFSVIFQG